MKYEYLFGGEAQIVWVTIRAWSPIRGDINSYAGFYYASDMEDWINRITKEFAKCSIQFESISFSHEDLSGIPF